MKSRRIAYAIASATLLVGGITAIASTPAAAAGTVGSSACNKTFDYSGTINTNAVNFRTGPGTSYTSLRLLNKGAHVSVYCLDITDTKTDAAWAYAKYTATGQHGWFYAEYLTGYV